MLCCIMFSRIPILSVTGWNMQKFDCFLSLCMEIQLSDDKYWTINLFRVQKRFLVFRMFFWWYNNVTQDLLHTAISFNLVYLASMSILGTPPGATWKNKVFHHCMSLWKFNASNCELNPEKVTLTRVNEGAYLQDPLPSPLPSIWKV